MVGRGMNGQMVENTSVLVGVCERVWVLELQQVLWTSNSIVVDFRLHDLDFPNFSLI